MTTKKVSMAYHIGFLVASLCLTLGQTAQAQVGSVENLIYQGRIANNGAALSAGVTTFEVSVFGGASNCLLYRETFTRDMTSASGHYSLAIGSGTRTDTLFSGSAPTHSLSDALRNIGTISNLNCGGSSGSFSPALSNDRRFQLRFNPGSGWVSLPSQAIKSSPYAMQAMQLNGYGIANLAKIDGAGASTVMSPAGWAKVMDYSELGNLVLGAGAAVTCDGSRAGGLRYNAGSVEFCNGTSWTVLSSGGSAISALTGDVTASGTGSVSATIATGAVNSAKILDGTIATVDIADAAITSLKINDGSVTANKLNQMSATSGQVLKWNGTAWAPAADDNTATPAWASITGKPTTLSGYGITDAMGNTLNSGLVWVGNGSNAATARNLNITDIKSSVSGNFLTASGACAAGQGLSYTSVTDSLSCQAESLTSSQVTTALGFSPANSTLAVLKAGDTMTGTLNLPSNGLVVGTNQLVVSGASVGVGTAAPVASSLMEMSSTTKGVLIPRMTTAQRDAISAPANGLQVYNTTTSQLNYYNGTSWQALGVAGAGISSLTAGTGLTGGTITTSGTIAVDVGTGNNQIVQLNGSAQLPAVSGVNLTNLNATNLASGSVPAARLPGFTGDATSSAGTAALTIANDAVTYAKMQNVSATSRLLGRFSAGAGDTEEISLGSGLALSGTGVLSLPTSCASTEVLKWNGTAWACAADATGAAPGDASYAAKGVVQFDTNAATSGLTVASGVARLANSGVTAGVYGSATQVPAITVDAFGRVTAVTATTIALPASAITSGTLSVAQGGTGVSSLTANRMVMVNGAGTALSPDACTANQLLQYNGTSWACVAATSLGTANAVVNNGNSYAGTMTVGTNDNNDLRFETNGTDKMTVLANGNVGIGTTSPNSKLQVTSNSSITSGSAYASSLDLQAVPTAASTATFYGSSISAMVSDNSNTSGASTIGGGFGAGAYTNSNATSLNRAIAIDAQLYSMRFAGASTATVNEAIGIRIGPMITAGGSIGRYAGATIMNNTSATHNVGIFMPLIGGSSSPNGNWTIYSESSFPSYFGGKIGIGTTSPAASASLDITSTNSGLLIPRMTTAQRDAIATPANGLQVYNTTTNQLNYYNGSAWQALGVAGSGISSLTAGTGLTGGSITTSGTIAVDTGTTANKIVQLNASAELPAVSGVNLTNLNASNIASGTLAAARLPSSGVTAGSYGSATQVPAITVDAYGRVTAVTATTIALPASAITSGTLNISQGGTGAAGLTANRMVMVNGTGTALTNDLCTVNQVLQYNGTTWACVNSASLGSTSAVLNGGNSFAGTMTVGTNDNNELRFETNGTDKMTVLANGNVGIGQTAPTERLHVAGTVRVDSGITFGGGGAVGNLGYVSGVFVLDSPSASPLGFSVNGASRMRIGTDGNVGIGPAYAQTGNRLEVQGGAIAAGPVSTGAGNAGQFRFYELAANGANFFALRAPDSLAADLTFTLPAADGSNGQVLTTNGSGVLSWSSSTVGFPLTGGIGSATAPTYSFAGDTNTGMYSTADNEIAFSTDGARRLSIYWWGIQTSGQIQNGNWNTAAYTPTSASLAAPAGNVFLSANNTANVDSSSTLSLMQVRNTANAAQNGYFGVIANMAGSAPSFVFGQSTGATAYAERMRIDGSGNVGIGTTTPSGNLVVAGTNVGSDHNGDNPVFALEPVNNGVSSRLRIWGSPGSPAIRMSTGTASGNARISLDASTVYVDQGDLQVMNTIRSQNGGGSTNNLTLRGTGSNDGVAFQTGGATERMRINSAGNVGIGTTSPRSRLEVAGGIQIADDAATCDATKVGTIRYNSSTIQFCNGSTWAGIGGGGGAVANGGNSFAGTMTVGTNDNNELRFETNGSDKMTVLANGNVGIGTTAPTFKLETQGTGSFQNQLTVGNDVVTNSSQLIVTNSFTTGSSTISLNTPNNSAYIRQTAVSGGDLTVNSAGPVKLAGSTATLATGGADRLFVASNGNVGVGTTSPATKLDVNGDVAVGGSTILTASFGWNSLKGGSNGASILDLSGNFILTAGGGKVGIGVNPGPESLQYSLGFTGGAAHTLGVQRELSSANDGKNLTVTAGSAMSSSTNKLGGDLVLRSGVATGTGSSNILFQTSTAGSSGTTDNAATTKMTINGAGNVGIGTTSPRSRLEVAGGIQIADDAAACDATKVGTMRYNTGTIQFCNGTAWAGVGGAANAVLVGGQTAGGGMALGTNDSFELYLKAGNLARVTIAPDGNVGIGTTSPGSSTRLNVNGQIRSPSSTTTSSSIDWVSGNSIRTSFDCGSAINFSSLRDGGAYTLVVSGTGTTMCTFNTTTTGDDAATVTYRFLPANAVRTASSHTLYSLQRIGTIVYVSWMTGF